MSQSWQIHSASAFYIAKSGRPGPVLVDITKDVTAADVMNISVADPAPINRETETIREEDIETALRDDRRSQRNRIFS